MQNKATRSFGWPGRKPYLFLVWAGGGVAGVVLEAMSRATIT